MSSVPQYVKINGTFLSPEKSDIVKYKEAEILSDLKEALGEHPKMEDVFKYLIFKIALLETEVFKPNSVKFITEEIP